MPENSHFPDSSSAPRHRWRIVHQRASGGTSCVFRCIFCDIHVQGRSAAGPRTADREVWTIPGTGDVQLAPLQRRPPCKRQPAAPAPSRPRAARGGDRVSSLTLDAYLADLTVEDLREARAARPKTRADCVDGPRPCPWVGCRHHLALEAFRQTVRVSQAFLDGTAAETCALDVAEKQTRGEDFTLREMAEWMGVSHERIRQTVEEGLRTLRTSEAIDVWRELERRRELMPGADADDE